MVEQGEIVARKSGSCEGSTGTRVGRPCCSWSSGGRDGVFCVWYMVVDSLVVQSVVVIRRKDFVVGITT